MIQVIEACLACGIEPVPCDFYMPRNIPRDPVKSGQEYYEAYLAPRAHFPWYIEGAIKYHVRRRLKEDNKKSQVVDEVEFELESFLTKLARSADPKRAQSMSRMLLEYAFGKKSGGGYATPSRRQFPADKWSEMQRRSPSSNCLLRHGLAGD